MDKDVAIARLKGAEAELRQRGVKRLSLFGSTARGDAGAASDVDLAAEFDENAKVGLFKYFAISDRLQQILGTQVDLVCEPADKPRLQAGIDRDRILVF